MENLGLSVCNVFTVDWVTCSFANTDVYSVIGIMNLDPAKFSFSEKLTERFFFSTCDRLLVLYIISVNCVTVKCSFLLYFYEKLVILLKANPLCAVSLLGRTAAGGN